MTRKRRAGPRATRSSATRPRSRPFGPLARSAAVPFLSILLAGYFGFHAVQGDAGLIAWGRYRAEQAALQQEARAVRERKAELQHRVALLDPAAVNPDLADELVRVNLGLVRADEVIVPLPKGR